MTDQAVIAELRNRGYLNPEQFNAMSELARRGKLDEDILADAIADKPKAGTATRLGRAAVRGALSIPGLPGDVASILPADNTPPMLKKLPTTGQLVQGAENLTGQQLVADEQTGFGEKAAETVAGGLVGGVNSLVRKGVQGAAPFARELASNVGGSVATQAGATIGGNATGSPLGEVGGGVAGIGLLAALKGGAKAAATGGFMPWDEKRKQFREALERADQNVGGITSPSTLAQGGILRRTQSALESIPGSHGYLQEYGQKINQAAMKRLQTLVGNDPAKVSRTLQERAGEAILTGVDRRITAVRKQSTDNYALASKLVGDKTELIQMTNTEAALRKLLVNPDLSEQERALIEGFRSQVMPGDAAQSMLTTVQQNAGGATYRAVDDIRQTIGKQIDSKALIGDKHEADFKLLYKALNDDLLAGAKLLGGEEAARAVRSAGVYWKAEKALTKKVFQPLANKGPELENVFRGVLSKDLSQTTKLRSVLKTLTPEERTLVSRAWVARLGRLPDAGGNLENWNVASFVKQWDDSSEVGRKLILQGTNPGYARDMESFVESMRDVARGGGLMANPSGTAAKGLSASTIYYGLMALGGAAVAPQGMEALGAAAGVVFSGAAGSFAANQAARLMTNQTFIRWAAQSANSRNLPMHLGRLQAIAAQSDDPLFVNDIDSFAASVSALGEAMEPRTRRDNPRAMRYEQ